MYINIYIYSKRIYTLYIALWPMYLFFVFYATYRKRILCKFVGVCVNAAALTERTLISYAKLVYSPFAGIIITVIFIQLYKHLVIILAP